MAFPRLDPAMELDTGKSFREVVDEEGWLGFRAREYRICKQFAKTARGKTVLEETAELIETLQSEHLICMDRGSVEYHLDQALAEEMEVWQNSFR
jgi:shikimate kinase